MSITASRSIERQKLNPITKSDSSCRIWHVNFRASSINPKIASAFCSPAEWSRFQIITYFAIFGILFFFMIQFTCIIMMYFPNYYFLRWRMLMSILAGAWSLTTRKKIANRLLFYFCITHALICEFIKLKIWYWHSKIELCSNTCSKIWT